MPDIDIFSQLYYGEMAELLTPKTDAELMSPRR